MIPYFGPYKYEKDKTNRPFELVCEGVNLNDQFVRRDLRNNKKLKELGDTPGVYLWVMRCSVGEFKIYVGKTESLSRRLGDYTNKFQVHSPNDYKLRFFQTFLEENFGDLGATMDLYFLKSTAAEYTKLENEIIEEYAPFVNGRSQLDSRAIDLMQRAFKNHYVEIFCTKLGLPLSPTSAPE